jgi:hypothetical protein
MIITFDPLDEIQRSLVRWKALAKAFRFTPPTPNSATQPKSEITKPPQFSYSQKNISLSENVTRKIYYYKTHDENTYSQSKPTPLKESRPMLTGHHSSKLHEL